MLKDIAINEPVDSPHMCSSLPSLQSGILLHVFHIGINCPPVQLNMGIDFGGSGWFKKVEGLTFRLVANNLLFHFLVNKPYRCFQ